jgi:hypothetical protein
MWRNSTDVLLLLLKQQRHAAGVVCCMYSQQQGTLAVQLGAVRWAAARRMWTSTSACAAAEVVLNLKQRSADL